MMAVGDIAVLLQLPDNDAGVDPNTIGELDDPRLGVERAESSNERIDLRGIQGALGHLRLLTISERVHDNEL